MHASRRPEVGCHRGKLRVTVLLSAVTTPVRASVQTGEPPNLARKGDLIGLTTEAGGFARPRPPFGRCPGLTTVVTGRGLRYPGEIRENSRRINPFSLDHRRWSVDHTLAAEGAHRQRLTLACRNGVGPTSGPLPSAPFRNRKSKIENPKSKISTWGDHICHSPPL